MTRLERWIYRDLLDFYYDKERPLPTDIDVVCKEIGVRTPEERVIVVDLLGYKFSLTEDGYEHERCETVIAEYRKKAETAQENGKLGAATRYRNGEYMPSEGTLYAVRVSPDLVKVGITTNLKSRLNQLRKKYGRQASVLHQVTVKHMGDAEEELLDAYASVRSGEEIPVSVARESALISHMDRIRVAYALVGGSHPGRIQVASGSQANQEPITNNQEPKEETAVVIPEQPPEEPPAPPSMDLIPKSRGAEISLLMRSNGVEGCNASNPIVQDWAANRRVTDDLLLTAASMAKERNVTRPGPNYLKPIIEQLLDPPAPKAKADDWKRSPKGVESKASELGIYARPGETHDGLRERCESELRKRAQGVQA